MEQDCLKWGAIGVNEEVKHVEESWLLFEFLQILQKSMSKGLWEFQIKEQKVENNHIGIHVIFIFVDF